jgi:alkylation response protein AidB-like acyl-CoA dehydrogenase
MDQACLDLTLARSRDGTKAGHKPGPESSIFKLYGTELNQRRRELMVAILGPQAIGWDGVGFEPGELAITRDWLRSRGNTIEGGTSEIQLNIIAKRVLGLPD